MDRLTNKKIPKGDFGDNFYNYEVYAMLSCRKSTSEDSKTVVSWLSDETSFEFWSGGRFLYPMTKEQLDDFYNDTQYTGMIVENDGVPIGHFFIQKLNTNKYKLGLIIVDPSQRGKGYGRRLVEEAIRYCKDNYNADAVMLCVFENNIAAYECYKKLGFHKNGKYIFLHIANSEHKYIELEYSIKKS